MGMVDRGVLTLALIGIVRAYIEVVGPSHLKNKLWNNKFDHQIWTFAPVPFESSINGTVSMFKHAMGCDPSSELTVQPTAGKPVIVFMAYGGCSLPDKVINAQKAGASMAVFLEISGLQKDKTIYHREDTATEITIPSTRILNSAEAEPFIQLICSTNEELQLSMTFKMTRWAKPKVILKANILFRNYLKTLVEMNRLYPGIFREIEFRPAYKMLYSPSAESRLYYLFGKTFFFPKSNYDVENKDQPIFENIRQLCLWNNSHLENPVKDYIEGFYQNCYDRDNFLREYLYHCSEVVKDLQENRAQIDSALRHFGIDGVVGWEPGYSPEERYNDLRYRLYDNLQTSQLIEFASPGSEQAIIINDAMMFSGGNLDGLNVLNLICRSFSTRPAICDKFDEIKVPWYIRLSPSTDDDFPLGFRLVFVGIIIALAVLYCFKPKLVRAWAFKLYDPFQKTAVEAELVNYTNDTSFMIEEFESS